MARSISSERPSSSKAGRLSVADSTAWAALASSAASKAAWVMASRASSRISASVTSDTELRICCCSLSARAMGTAYGRVGVLGSALIHTKTGAHREDVAQHAGDRFGSPITRRPDAAALSDGADSPPVSIPALRMPPRKPQMTRRTRWAWPIVSICNRCRAKPGPNCYRSRQRGISVQSKPNLSVFLQFRTCGL